MKPTMQELADKINLAAFLTRESNRMAHEADVAMASYLGFPMEGGGPKDGAHLFHDMLAGEGCTMNSLDELINQINSERFC
jgi:hypothetical protein